MTRHLRPSAATLIAALSLFVAMGSTGYAAGLLGGEDIRNGSLTGKDLKDGSVRSKDVQNLTGADVKPDSVGGTAVDEDSLGMVPMADHATSSENALSADLLGGHPSNEFLRATGCQTGKRTGYVLVKANAGTIPADYTTSGNHLAGQHSCSGSAVEVRRVGTGQYRVKFAEAPSNHAFVQIRTDQDGLDINVCAAVRKIQDNGPDFGAFHVLLMTCDGTTFRDADFDLLLP